MSTIPTTPDLQSIFIARQPIYNHRLEPIGYELLYRAGQTDRADMVDGCDASAQVILHAFLNIGIDRLVGSSLAFINVPEALLLDDAQLPMFHEQIVLEVLETVHPGEAVQEGLRRLRRRGFRIAFDDFVYRSDYQHVLPLADYVKLDVQAEDAATLADEVRHLRNHSAQIIAEKVETHAQYRQCRELGVDCFQGYFFCRPETLRDTTLPPNRAVVLALLRRLAEPELEMRELEAVLAADIALSYKLLRYVNSAAFSLRREIESLKDAIVITGLNTIQHWAMLVLVQSVNTGKPRELIRTGMVRARMCERLAEMNAPALRSQMFITGLFSVLDAMFDIPMERLLDEVPLTAPIKFALLAQEGRQGAILRQVLQYERGEWDALIAAGADRDQLVAAYLEAVQWADRHIELLIEE